jgi:tetratricopeptide (TPR) repeat protein
MTHIFGSVSMSDQVIYTVGGTVQAGGGIYISRDADQELLRLCRAGEFCYVLTARQMGKSSLMVATIERLAAEGILSVAIDLTEMGSKLSGLTAEQWYLGLIEFIVGQLDLDVDYVAWWDERAHLGPTQRLSRFLRQVVLEQVPEPVVIFVDEIESTRNLGFTDDFFAAVRACYNVRATDPTFKRLSFVLLGAATPGDLISDPQRTPFNIGRRIDLADFTDRQAIPLAAGLGLPSVEAGQVLTWILGWTGGHPYMTQRLCAAAAASPTKNWNVAAVDGLVEKTFFGEQSAQDSNLRFVRDMLTQRASDKAAVLKTYRSIHTGKAVPDEERSPVKTHLKLSGIVKAKGGYLRIRNEIYRRVFDLDWAKENTVVNWAPVVAGVAVFVALLAVSSILYNAWVGIQSQDCIANFYQTNAPEERLAHLAQMFRLQGLFGPTDYDYRARELFYGLSREEQLALVGAHNEKDSDLMVVIRGLYITLADTDGTDRTRPLLEAMVKVLGDLDATEETRKLEGEINSWLEGRKLAGQNQYAGALAEYNKAIALNGENPATLYERAKVRTELSEYQQALNDLDQVVAIARRAPAPTPATSLTPTSTLTPSVDMTPSRASPSISVTATSTPLPISTETPIPTATPTPAAIISEFTTIGEIISAVRNIIYGSPALLSFLESTPGSAYPNLEEFGLVPALTLTLTLTQELTLESTLTLTPTLTQELTLEFYPAPTLVNPALGATIRGKKLTEFSWEWEGILQEREHFDLRIWRSEKSQVTIAWSSEMSLPLDTPPDGFGQYLWQVAVVGIDESGNVTTLSESSIWPFVWTDVTPTPIPADTHTPPIEPAPATSTPSPISTTEPTPSPTPIAAPYPAPVLVEPVDGITSEGLLPLLDWHWEHELAEDEYFEVRIWHEGEFYHTGIVWVKQPFFDFAIEGLSPGKYFWSIAVVRGNGVKSKGWPGMDAWEGIPPVTQLSEESEIRSFFIY